VSVGTPFHTRAAALNRKLAWGDWAGYHAAAVYADALDIEYNAIREAAAAIDVSPLFKYLVSGQDAVRLVDRVIPRDAGAIAVDQVIYTPWCDERGKTIDDGTITRLDETTFRWTAADPSLRWLMMNAHGLDVAIEDASESLAALALQGPLARAVLEAATGGDWSDVRYFRRRPARIAGVDVDVTRTGYTGDLGYELWIPAAAAAGVWDAVFAAGAPYGIRPAGIQALDVVRLEAGLILVDVDYTGARHAMTAEHEYSPFELGLGRLVRLDGGDFVGRRALRAEQAAGGPARRLVGLELAWEDFERAYAAHDLPPGVPMTVLRAEIPVYRGGRQVGRTTSTGWSPILKKMIALASVAPESEPAGSELWVEWTVEGTRSPVAATVVPLPFLDLERKRA
jgi:aminomethyltransferase